MLDAAPMQNVGAQWSITSLLLGFDDAAADIACCRIAHCNTSMPLSRMWLQMITQKPTRRVSQTRLMTSARILDRLVFLRAHRKHRCPAKATLLRSSSRCAPESPESQLATCSGMILSQLMHMNIF